MHARILTVLALAGTATGLLAAAPAGAAPAAFEPDRAFGAGGSVLVRQYYGQWGGVGAAVRATGQGVTAVRGTTLVHVRGRSVTRRRCAGFGSDEPWVTATGGIRGLRGLTLHARDARCRPDRSTAGPSGTRRLFRNTPGRTSATGGPDGIVSERWLLEGSPGYPGSRLSRFDTRGRAMGDGFSVSGILFGRAAGPQGSVLVATGPLSTRAPLTVRRYSPSGALDRTFAPDPIVPEADPWPVRMTPLPNGLVGVTVGQQGAYLLGRDGRPLGDGWSPADPAIIESTGRWLWDGRRFVYRIGLGFSRSGVWSVRAHRCRIDGSACGDVAVTGLAPTPRRPILSLDAAAFDRAGRLLLVMTRQRPGAEAFDRDDLAVVSEGTYVLRLRPR